MRLLRHSVLPGALTGIVVDLVLCFVAVLLAASTLTSRYMTIPRAVPELPLILLGATQFALVMALMYAFVGLYRPKPISTIAAVVRTVVALCIGGYLTSLTLRVVADRGYIEQLIPAAISYLGVGLLLARGCFRVLRRVSPVPRLLIVGTGPEARAIAADLGRPGRTARQVIGFYSTSVDSLESDRVKDGPRIFPSNECLTNLVSRYDIQEIIVAVREHRGGGVPMDQLLACRLLGVTVLDLAGFWEKTKWEVPIDSLKGSWLVYGQV
jgi:FlaA1/EpsC-like NDP-sugar epimerase